MRRKKVIFFVFFVLLVGTLVFSKGMLRIGKKYPRWFRYAGERIYVITNGTGAVPQGSTLNELCNAGVNGFRTHIFLNTSRPKNCPYKLGSGASVDNNWNGWNDTLFTEIQRDAKELEKRDSILFVVVGGTPMRKVSKEEWGTHCWNKVNGGPMASTLHGVREFYKLGQSGFVYDKPYQGSWKWELKSQYRFEQLLKKINDALPEEKYPNVAILLMWEISSGWPSAIKWAPHMVKLLQKLTEYRPIGLGTGSPAHLNVVNVLCDRPVFGTFEGQDYFTRIEENRPAGRYPIICQGFHCQKAGFYSGQRPQDRCKCFVPGAEETNIAGAKENIICCVIAGINTSLPFPSYWRGIDIYVKKVCKDEYPQIFQYDTAKVQKETLRFIKAFSTRVQHMNLKRVPGRKTKSKMDKWRRETGF